MYPANVKAEGVFSKRRDADVLFEIRLVRGVKNLPGFNNDVFAVGAHESLPKRGGKLRLYRFSRHQHYVVAVGNAVVIYEQPVFHSFAVDFIELCGTEKTFLLVVEKDEGDFRPLLCAQRVKKLTESYHAGGVVVDGVSVGLSEKHQQEKGEKDEEINRL